MATYSTTDLSRKSGDIIADALRRPVTITQRKKPRLVLLSIEDFQRLAAHGDTRKSMTTDRIDGELFKEITQAINAYAAAQPED